MATWSKNPTYTPLSAINNGSKYQDGDFIWISDLNKLFENVKYLKGDNNG
jgi:hypothetical protein